MSHVDGVDDGVGYGVYGSSNRGRGVSGVSGNDIGVFGSSSGLGGVAVYGSSGYGPAVYGSSFNYSVVGESYTGVGVHGITNRSKK